MSTVRDVFERAGLHPTETVRWGDSPEIDHPGIYVVAQTADLDFAGGLQSAPISNEAVEELLAARPELRVRGRRPSPEELAAALSSMWVPNEPILYIGMTDASVRKRVLAYYRTRLGARQPHAGGWPIKMLTTLRETFVFVSPCADPGAAEAVMIGAFAQQVPASALDGYCDPVRVMPFANLEFPKGNRKMHGISGAREPRQPRVATPVPRPAVRAQETSPGRASKPMRTQRVTATDIAAGRIRIPATSKLLFPADRTRVRVVLRGATVDARWDPRIGLDRERSGVLSVPRELLARLVVADEVLQVARAADAIAVH